MIPGNPHATGAKKSFIRSIYAPHTVFTNNNFDECQRQRVSHPPVSPDPVIDETFEGSSSTILSVMDIGDITNPFMSVDAKLKETDIVHWQVIHRI